MATDYKAPWELTKQQYKAFRRKGITASIWENKSDGPGSWGKRKWDQRSVQLHRDSIESAIASGRTVPAKVLRDYPDLRAKSKRR